MCYKEVTKCCHDIGCCAYPIDPMAETEGFEPSHRSYRPTPLAEEPLMTAWVRLQIKNMAAAKHSSKVDQYGSIAHANFHVARCIYTVRCRRHILPIIYTQRSAASVAGDYCACNTSFLQINVCGTLIRAWFIYRKIIPTGDSQDHLPGRQSSTL